MPDDINPFDPFCGVPMASGHELLRRDGMVLQAPKDIPADQMRGRLWELIYGLAARRIFLSSTDHLVDEELYRWLYHSWLVRPAPDLPPEDDWDTRVDLLGGGSEMENQIWLRYYADDEVREEWKRRFPEDAVPARESRPFDRDRWLPQPPILSVAPPSSNLPDLADEDDLPFTPPELIDPLRLEEVDREIHRDAPPFDMGEAESDDFLSARAGEALLRPEESLAEPAVGIETESWEQPHEALSRAGVILLPPDELTDEVVPARLWELLHELACRGFYVLHTDHLSDRDLYSRLWREDLREPALLPGRSAAGGWFHDLVGSGSVEDVMTWLRYFADDEAREQHARDWPDDPMPPRERPPYNRDRRLPQGPF